MDQLLFSIKKIIPLRLFQYFQPWYHFAMALCAALLFGFPSRKLIVIGVTGTKGKTTVVELLHEIFAVSGVRVASLSSLRFKINADEIQNDKKMTMPGRFFVQQFLWRARRAKCRYVILEVTSEGIKQFRHRFIAFDAAVMTQVAPEHIEAHGGFEQYIRAKLDLFWRLDPHAAAIINRDDPLARRFAAATAARKIYYGKRGIEENNMMWGVRDLHIGNKGIQFELNKQSFSSPLLGEFNFYNIMAAIAVARSQHVAIGKIAEGIARVASVPGRFEFLQQEPFSIVVDYAHTPDSLRSVYETLAQEQKKLICVLGAAGGGRDRWKRPAMGKIAQEFCREIILTNEDPYDEDPNTILEDIVSGISHALGLKKILDRREAIRTALSHAQKNDCVIITGKGSESWIMGPRGAKTAWNEKEVVEEELRKKELPKIIEDVGFDFHWDSKKVWALDEPVVTMDIDELVWHFDIPFWEMKDTDDYNLTPKEVIKNPDIHSAHYRKIQEADLKYPIDIMENKGRWLILDGLHRLVKGYLQGMKTVKVRKIPRSRIPEILR